MNGSVVVIRCWLLIGMGTASLVVSSLNAETVLVMDYGMDFRGSYAPVSGIASDPLEEATGGNVPIRPIAMLDDDLRRTFVRKNQVREFRESKVIGHERFQLKQRVTRSGHRIGGVGRPVGIEPFDQWGRRTITLNVKGQGLVPIVQGMTEITPLWIKVEALSGSKRSLVWDMRIATSSVPRETLTTILHRVVGENNPEGRLRIVQFFIQAERYRDAEQELESTLQQFSELTVFERQATALRQLKAQQLMNEVRLRRQAGRHGLTRAMLENFPDQDVAGETLLRIRNQLDEYQRWDERIGRIGELLSAHLARVEDEEIRSQLAPVLTEITQQLNYENLNRMADYLRLADDENLRVEQKLALAVSGWYLGEGQGQQNLTVSRSLARVAVLIRRYLAPAPQAQRREILETLLSEEGSAPEYLAAIIRNITPPRSFPTTGDVPGMYQLVCTGVTGDTSIEYLIQLPPEYDPYHRYPTIVALHALAATPEMAIDWWAGGYDEAAGERLGQATRHGYIVIAPKWPQPGHRQYGFSVQEHAAVLHSLRDAMHRFSVDTDRVFISGHSAGATAAWDVALAHPDLWAGMIAIGATADKYISRYWPNGKHVPSYFVVGELDGTRVVNNSREWDRYLQYAGFNATIVEYLGRGHEHYQEEIQRLFRWMELLKREFPQKEFKCYTMRDWDNFFWWTELRDFPSRSVVSPLDWPPSGGERPSVTTGKILSNNHLRLSTGAARATIFLSPDWVDFEKPIKISVAGGRRVDSPAPSVQVLLDDVLTRGDRQHPFWAKVELRTGRK